MRCKSIFLQRASAPLLLLGGIGGAPATSAGEMGVAALGAGYTADDAPLGLSTELRIDLRGEIPARCRMAAPPMLGQQIDFNRQGQVQANFGLDCNAPFQLRVRSGAGSFAADEAREGIKSNIPYEVSIDVDTDAGHHALGWCRADQLSDQPSGGCVFGAGAGWSSGDATAIDRTGMMKLRWDGPSEAEAPALGRYRDTIVVELSVRS